MKNIFMIYLELARNRHNKKIGKRNNQIDRMGEREEETERDRGRESWRKTEGSPIKRKAKRRWREKKKKGGGGKRRRTG